jgi:hypothetical protein
MSKSASAHVEIRGHSSLANRSWVNRSWVNRFSSVSDGIGLKPKAAFRLVGLLCVNIIVLGLLSGFALARVPLGSSVPAAVRGKIIGPYWLAFYTRSCLEPKLLERQWEALRTTKLEVLAVNPVEKGNVAAPIPKDFLGLTGSGALELTRALRVKSYPTTVLVDANNVIRVALEGPITAEQVRESLNLLPSTP